MAILGDDFSNKLTGTAGADTIDAKGGNDILIGLGGNDALYGGSGDDTYEFSGKFSTDMDRIWESTGDEDNDTIHILTGSNVGDIPASAVRIMGIDRYFDHESVEIFVDGFGMIHLNSQLLDPKVEWLKIGDNDRIPLNGGLPMTGSAFGEAIKGTQFNDTINSMGGNDNLYGGSGDDTYEFSGKFSTDMDRIWELPDGGDNDTIHIITGTNAGDIPASAVRIMGIDRYFDHESVEIFVDGFGMIHLNSQLLDPKVEWLKIGDNDRIPLNGGLPMTGSAFGEAIKGTQFNDTINSMGGNDNLYGGSGNDTYEFSGKFSTDMDRIWESTGGGDNDTIHILTGSNVGDIPASAVRIVGIDRYFDHSSVEIFADGFGMIHLNNQLAEANVEWLKIGDSAPISLEWLQIATGTSISLTSGLTMAGSIDIQTINGSAYSDIIDGKGGNDTLIGNLGNDTYIIGNIGVTVTENLNEGTDIVKSSISYSLPANVENLSLTGSLAINGTGNGLNNKLIGNSAANQLKGNGGNDTLDGKAGNNTLTGGGGQDTFKLTTAGHIDAISDFVVVDDTIQLENAVFTALTTPGTLAVGQLRIGTQAVDANDFIIYNNVTGALLYDANGSGAGAAVQIATLSGGLAMTNADFVVI